MERKQMANILIPAVAVALLIALVGAIVASGSKAPPAGKPGAPGAPPVMGAEGMVAERPEPTAPEWKDFGSGGLKIWDVTEGTGEPAKAGQSVTVFYTGWLLNGTKFDGNRDRAPISFGLNQVIKGWTEGIPGMKPGGVRRLYIPSAMAYGSQDKGNIPPNSDLIFEVKLVAAN